jgi:hypothetical protein
LFLKTQGNDHMRFTIKAKLALAFGLVIVLSLGAGRFAIQPLPHAFAAKSNGHAGNGISLDLAATEEDAHDREFVRY